MRGDRPRRRDRAGAAPGRRHRVCAGSPRCWTAALRRHHPAHPPALGSRARAAVLPGRRPRRRPGHAAAAGPGFGGRAPRRCWPAACRRRTSRSARTACAATGPSAPLPPGQLKAEGFTRGGPRGPAQGRPDLRVPGQRRALGADLHPRPLPHRARARAGRAGRVPPGRAGPGGRRGPAHPRRVPAGRRGRPRRRRSGTRRPNTRSGLGGRAGARRVVLAHHKPDRTDADLDQLAARSRGQRPAGLPDVIVGAEGGILDL